MSSHLTPAAGSASQPVVAAEALKVIIADDDPLARRAIRDALQDHGIVVIAEAAEGHDAVELVLHYDPDVVLMDVVLPRIDGITATRQILKRHPHVVVVMVSANEDPELGLMCLRAGASGFLPKTVSLETLPRAVRAAAAGEAVVTRRLTAELIDRLRRSSPDGTGLRPVRSELTSREWEVLDLLCRQLSTDEIADTLVLSHETVRSHVKNILRKLGVRSRKEAIEVARELRSGIVKNGKEAA
ncbi:MAG: response regulator transcription factor [Actinobacteria bacterium]|nr:MAG: response regulator transcription factor [Actinomycetota bacterium]